MMTGYLAAFGFVFLLIIGIYCFGYAARQASLLYVLLLETGLGLVFILPLLFLEKGFTLPGLFSKPSAANLLWLGTAALVSYAGGNYFTLLNLRTAGEKINSLLSPAITAFTVVLSYFVFKERLSPLQAAGTILTLLVVTWFLLTGSPGKKKAANHNVGMWSGLATIACISLGIIASIKGASGTLSYLHAIWLRLFFAFVLVAGAFLLQGAHRTVERQGARFYLVVILGVLAQTLAANYLWLHASFHIGISVFQVIIATLPLWVYAADVYGFKQSRPSARFLLIALLALAGVLMVVR